MFKLASEDICPIKKFNFFFSNKMFTKWINYIRFDIP
jgi:hypothetical protein